MRGNLLVISINQTNKQTNKKQKQKQKSENKEQHKTKQKQKPVTMGMDIIIHSFLFLSIAWWTTNFKKILILNIVWGGRVMKRGFIWMFSPEASLPFDSKIPYVWNDYCPVSVHAISPSEESSQQDETGRSSFLLSQLDWDTWHHPSAAKHEWRDLKLLCYHTCGTYCCFPRDCHDTWSKCRRPSSHICLKIFIEKCNTVMIFLTMKSKSTFFKSLSDKS